MAVEKATMNLRVALLCLIVSVLVGCPYDRLRPPYLRNEMDIVVEARIMLTNGAENVFMLEKGNRLMYSADPGSIARVTFIARGDVVDEIDAERIAEMLKCTPDPRDVIWHIEAGGLRPSVPCRPPTR